MQLMLSVSGEIHTIIWRLGVGSFSLYALTLMAGLWLWEWTLWRLFRLKRWPFRAITRRGALLYFVTWIGASAFGVLVGIWLIAWSFVWGWA